MPRTDLQSEWAFYGRKLDTIGHLYLRNTKMPAKSPDILFFLLFTCRLLTDKKLSITGANFIHNNLEHTSENWLKILNWEEDRPFSCTCRVIPYRGYAKSAFSSSILFKDDRPVFRFGHMGFGFFSNKKFFDFCSGGAVFGLMESIYNMHSKEPKERGIGDRRKLSAEGKIVMEQLFTAAALVRRLQLGPDLNRGNCVPVAYLLYQKATGDTYPPITPEEQQKFGPIADRVFAELEKARARQAELLKEQEAAEAAAEADCL